MQARYIIGIDLGTTNSVVAYTPCEEEGKISFLPIAQLIKAGVVEEQPVLPSFLYLPAKHEIAKGSFKLPWCDKLDYCVGEFARRQGSLVPNRLVSSAKSWLCHRGVDRKSDLLPFQASPDVHKISPVEASSRYLSHLRDCWNHALGQKKEDAFENQMIYLTVPASFDAVARELTVLAAQKAGLEATLIEEPQAAFYAWLYNNEKMWRRLLKVGDLVLVVDVGGGTTDLTLVSVVDEGGNLILKRDAVGDHILLGGDNMDVALAHVVSKKLPAAKLDAWQSVALWHTCREIKEKILSDESVDKLSVSILGRGSSVVGSSLKTDLTREDVEKTLVEGFFPIVASHDHGGARKKIGFTQMYLPYASEPAITRHIARFLHEHRREEKDAFIAPTAVLFNGGVFNAELLRRRVVEVISQWLKDAGKPPVKVLESSHLELSVAQGAAYYGKARLGKGIRIRSGVGQSYYIGIETSMPAVPGMPLPMKALCVVPHGMEEGTESDIPEVELGLTVGEPVEFPFFSSNRRKKDPLGMMIESIEEDIERNSSLEATLNPTEDVETGKTIPVRLHTKATEVGTIEISCSTLNGKGRWRLEFNIRGNEGKTF